MKVGKKKRRRGLGGHLLLIVILLLAAYQILPLLRPGVEFGPWEYSMEGAFRQWIPAELPFQTHYGGSIIYFKSVMEVPEHGNAKFRFFVDDCIERILVNGYEAFRCDFCGSCTHCNGIEIDLSDFVNPGYDNIIEAEVSNIGNTGTGFDVEIIEDGSPLWIFVALLAGVFLAKDF